MAMVSSDQRSESEHDFMQCFDEHDGEVCVPHDYSIFPEFPVVVIPIPPGVRRYVIKASAGDIYDEYGHFMGEMVSQSLCVLGNGELWVISKTSISINIGRMWCGRHEQLEHILNRNGLCLQCARSYHNFREYIMSVSKTGPQSTMPALIVSK